MARTKIQPSACLSVSDDSALGRAKRPAAAPKPRGKKSRRVASTADAASTEAPDPASAPSRGDEESATAAATPTHAADSEDDMVPAPASTAGREMGQCRFCGVAVDASNGLRQGNAQYPSWICRTCRQGERDMVAAAKNRGEEGVAALNKIRTENPAEYKRRVAAIVHACDGGANTLAQRREAAGDHVEFFCRFVAHKVRNRRRWLTRLQYIAHFRMHEGFSKKQAREKWSTDVNDRNILKRKNVDNEITLPVVLPVEDEWVDETRNGRKGNTTVRPPTDAPDDREQQAHWIDDFEGNPELCMGEEEAMVFRTSAAARATPNDARNLEQRHAVTGRKAKDGDVFEENDGTLKATREDFSLTDARQYVLNNGRALIRTWSETKSSVYKTVEDLVHKLGSDHVEVEAMGVAASLGKFKDRINELEGLHARTNQWNGQNFHGHFTHWKQSVVSAREAHVELSRMLDTLKTVRRTENNAANALRRKRHLAVRRLLGKPHMTSSMPNTMYVWLSEDVFVLTDDMKAFRDPAKHTAAITLEKCDMNPGPAFFEKTSDTCDSIEGLAGLYEETIAESVARCKSVIAKNDTPYVFHRTKGERTLTDYTEAAWWSDLGGFAMQKEADPAFAVLNNPWVFAGSAYSFRLSRESFPMQGVGGFWHQTEGDAMLFMWAMDRNEKAGGSSMDVSAMFRSMQPAEVCAFLRDGVTRITAVTGSATFIPFGHTVMVWHTSDTSVGVFFPFFSQKLFQAVPDAVQELVLESLGSLCDQCGKSKLIGPMIPALKLWVHQAEVHMKSAS